jgi:hypothetical protein
MSLLGVRYGITYLRVQKYGDETVYVSVIEHVVTQSCDVVQYWHSLEIRP